MFPSTSGLRLPHANPFLLKLSIYLLTVHKYECINIFTEMFFIIANAYKIKITPQLGIKQVG